MHIMRHTQYKRFLFLLQGCTCVNVTSKEVHILKPKNNGPKRPAVLTKCGIYVLSALLCCIV